MVVILGNDDLVKETQSYLGSRDIKVQSIEDPKELLERRSFRDLTSEGLVIYDMKMLLSCEVPEFIDLELDTVNPKFDAWDISNPFGLTRLFLYLNRTSPLRHVPILHINYINNYVDPPLNSDGSLNEDELDSWSNQIICRLEPIQLYTALGYTNLNSKFYDDKFEGLRSGL